MGLQFRYQRAKLYREVAMGEKHHMTVSQGEGGKGSSCAVLHDNLNPFSAFRGKAFQSTVSTGLPPWNICMSLYLQSRLHWGGGWWHFTPHGLWVGACTTYLDCHPPNIFLIFAPLTDWSPTIRSCFPPFPRSTALPALQWLYVDVPVPVLCHWLLYLAGIDQIGMLWDITWLIPLPTRCHCLLCSSSSLLVWTVQHSLQWCTERRKTNHLRDWNQHLEKQ